MLLRRCVIIAIGLALLPALAFAQERRNPTRDQRSETTEQISGEIQSVANVKLKNSDTWHKLVRIRTSEGKTLLVDLGPSNDPSWRNMLLQLGEKISARGQLVQIGDQKVFFATSAKSGDQNIAVRRKEPVPGTDTTARSDKSGPEQRIEGKIARTKAVQWRGSKRREFIALVETQGGKQVIVDLGPTTGLKKAKLKAGMNIIARGQMKELGDKNVLFANRLDFGNNSIVINRMKDAVEMKTIRGVVTRTKPVDWRESDRRELVALVKTQSGDMMTVDLGPVDRLREYGIQSGRAIAVRGPVVKLGSRKVLFANQVTTAEGTTQIDRPSADGSQTVSGVVSGRRHARVRNGEDINLLILVTTHEGDKRIVDVGKDSQAKKYGLQEGDKVTFKGRVYKKEGLPPVLIVREVSTDGRTHQVDRPVRSQSFRKQDD